MLSVQTAQWGLRDRDVDYFYVLLGPFLVHFRILNTVDDIHALVRSAEDSVFVVKPCLFR